MRLHTETLRLPGVEARGAALFLHGILGSGANLRTLARRVLERRPELALEAVLVDLRAHGASQQPPGDEDTLPNAAADVAQTARALALPARVLVGHSFGGKVALAVPALLPGLAHVASLDSAPGGRPEGRGSENTLQVVTVLESLGGPWATREGFVREVEARGLDRGVAQWLAMNLRRDEAGFRFGLSLPRIHALLDSYFGADLWPVLERAPADGPRFHLVVGEDSPVYEQRARARLAALAAAPGGRVTMDLVPGGHWVHVDALEATAAVLAGRLGG